ncbi:uncharacterized protein LOC115740096 isoform X1 [Rhodamnia argentea]|uniref:Uncharacterized protein LOC115740096 isoform X1 n=1 Tax=Rhodamnia argentea TaxID=178133 RepID=A0A8B8P410_9MYRT|nr:uncharacterized protein LOC115740096 isoform X1 [Rhodamnia argentea]
MDINPPNAASLFADQKCRKSCFCNLFPAASLFCLALFIGSALLASDYREKFSGWDWRIIDKSQSANTSTCANQCRPRGSEALPDGIVTSSSDLEMRPLWNSAEGSLSSLSNLFAVAVGIKQKDLVNKMVTKFLSNDFVVMLFHYDGVVDEWKDLEWSGRVIHVSAFNQTKWWFAKRFLHPDIVAEYKYIFLWDEDLGVEDFHPDKYISIIKTEGLEISQPALDPTKSDVHHQITARGRRSVVHRRTFKPGGPGKGCGSNSTAPPCTGWIEMMAPVFSRAAWRCVWYMIQNDLIHAWGLDTQLGYCAQGDRIKTVGIVDAEYIVHYNRPTLGGGNENQSDSQSHNDTSETEKVESELLVQAPSRSHKHDPRVEVRRQSYVELAIFRKRWKKAVQEDECWTDPYPQAATDNIMA